MYSKQELTEDFRRAAYIANDYHNASDVITSDWDLAGAVDDLQILLEVGYRVAQQPGRPTWKADAVWAPQAYLGISYSRSDADELRPGKPDRDPSFPARN